MRGGETHDQSKRKQRPPRTRANTRLTGCACLDLLRTRRSALATSSRELRHIYGSKPAVAANAGRLRSTARLSSQAGTSNPSPQIRLVRRLTMEHETKEQSAIQKD